VIFRQEPSAEKLPRRLWNRPIGGLLLMSALTLLVANGLDLASISSLGSAGFLLIFAAVNGANLRLRLKTNSRSTLSFLGMCSCLGALLMMLAYLWEQSRHHVWELITLLALVFLLQAIYQRFVARGRHSSLLRKPST
jgi:hypothetical protein